jgi:hypothetical protein
MDSAQESALSCLSCLGCWSQFKHEEQWALDDSRTKDFFASTNWNVSLYDMAVNLDSERHLFWDQPVMCRMCLSEWNFTICEWASISVYLSFRRTTSFFASMTVVSYEGTTNPSLSTRRRVSPIWKTFDVLLCFCVFDPSFKAVCCSWSFPSGIWTKISS